MKLNRKFLTILVLSFLFIIILPFYSVHASSTETLRPNAAGDVTQLLPKSAPNWGQVDEAVADSDTSYVENTETGVSGTYEADLYAIPVSAIPVGSTINNITIYSTSKKVQVGAAIVTNARPALKTNGTVTWGLAIAQTTSYVEKSQLYLLNPVTVAAWTLDEIKALQIGVSLQFQFVGDSRYSYARCTQVYVIIDYTPPQQGTSLTVNGVSTMQFSSLNLLAFQYSLVKFAVLGFGTTSIMNNVLSIASSSILSFNTVTSKTLSNSFQKSAILAVNPISIQGFSFSTSGIASIQFETISIFSLTHALNIIQSAIMSFVTATMQASSVVFQRTATLDLSSHNLLAYAMPQSGSASMNFDSLGIFSIAFGHTLTLKGSVILTLQTLIFTSSSPDWLWLCIGCILGAIGGAVLMMFISRREDE